MASPTGNISSEAQSFRLIMAMAADVKKGGHANLLQIEPERTVPKYSAMKFVEAYGEVIDDHPEAFKNANTGFAVVSDYKKLVATLKDCNYTKRDRLFAFFAAAPSGSIGRFLEMVRKTNSYKSYSECLKEATTKLIGEGLTAYAGAKAYCGLIPAKRYYDKEIILALLSVAEDEAVINDFSTLHVIFKANFTREKCLGSIETLGEFSLLGDLPGNVEYYEKFCGFRLDRNDSRMSTYFTLALLAVLPAEFKKRFIELSDVLATNLGNADLKKRLADSGIVLSDEQLKLLGKVLYRSNEENLMFASVVFFDEFARGYDAIEVGDDSLLSDPSNPLNPFSPLSPVGINNPANPFGVHRQLYFDW